MTMLLSISLSASAVIGTPAYKWEKWERSYSVSFQGGAVAGVIPNASVYIPPKSVFYSGYIISNGEFVLSGKTYGE